MKIKCFICGTEYECGYIGEPCPVCDWIDVGDEAERDPETNDRTNSVTLKQAKKNFAAGLNIWGDPLPKR